MYLSNRSDQHVFFDDFNVSITNSNILEENHYYSYGLRIAGISSKRITDTYDGLAKNNHLYNDKELWDDADLNWYDYGFRNYDPQIGRFTQLDPLTDDYPTMTPYQYASCDPILNIDIDGLEGGAANIVNDGTTFLTKTGQVLIREGIEVVIKATKKVTVSATKSSGFMNFLKKAADVVTDFVPIVGSIKDIYQGVRDGNGWQVAAGIGGLILDVATLGTASVVKGAAKTAVKQGIKTFAKQQIKSKTDDLVRTVKNKVDDVIKKKPPCGCFTAGTLVLTADGYKEIQTIQVGDIVWAYNDTTGQLAQKRVINVFEYERDSVYHITLANGTIIKATSDHPFFIGGRWLKVHELKAGDNTVLYNGEALAITHIEIVAQHTTVYNFEVEDFHTYYVSEQRVLVHNSGPMPCEVKPGNKVHGNSTQSQKPRETYTIKDEDGVPYHGVGDVGGNRANQSLKRLQKENPNKKFKIEDRTQHKNSSEALKDEYKRQKTSSGGNGSGKMRGQYGKNWSPGRNL
ncbi:MAG: hypothetical protein K2X48_13815 [Chitinophagaceae bacterium]|nr:hypothetical protein [Chitinophagaceae bacterium]